EYINGQAEHHGYDKRVRPPVSRYSDEESVTLTAAHATFELNHHLVFATRYRRGVFDSALGEALIQYWRRVASARGFAIDRVTLVPDHAHLLVRIAPKMSIEECALALLNNGRRFVGQRSPEALIRVKIEQLWQASAYAATTGGHDGVGEGISERARVGWTLTIPQLPLGGFGRVAEASGRLDLNHPPTAVGGIAKREKNEDCRSIKASVSAH